MKSSSNIDRFVFTVSTGRCGQASLTDLVRTHVDSCYPGFEEPSISTVMPKKLEFLERRFRRKFFETNELLGRGRALEAVESGDRDFMMAIARKRIELIEKKMSRNDARIYFDISKFFGRSLYEGFSAVVEKFGLVNLVRDPIANMRSYVNRGKNFALDNNLPDARSNILRLDVTTLEPGEFYLWSWCELNLRFDQLRNSPQVSQAVEIRTEDLNSPKKLNAAFDALGLQHSPVVARPPQNTNTERGLPETRISEADVELFLNFIDRVPAELKRRISYLKNYDPCVVHKIERVCTV